MCPHKNGNACFQQQKLSLLIFTCFKSTIKTSEQGEKSVKLTQKPLNAPLPLPLKH